MFIPVQLLATETYIVSTLLNWVKKKKKKKEVRRERKRRRETDLGIATIT